MFTYLVGKDEEQSIDKDGPDKNVCKDAGNERVLVGHHDGAVPVDGHKGPGQRARHGGHVDQARVGVVAEVERRQVEEVDNQNHLGPDEVRAHK